MIKFQEVLIGRLLDAVSKGNQAKAEKIIRDNPAVLLQYGSIKDPAGRDFDNITAFQYALWSLDIRHMASMMLSCISYLPDSEHIRACLLDQLNELEDEKIAYSFQNKIFKQSHFNLQPLISALQNYVDVFFNVDINQRKLVWCTEVGACQLDLTIYLRQRYCELDISFDYALFQRKKLERNLLYQNDYIGKKITWDETPDGLGTVYAIAGSRQSDNSLWCVNMAKAVHFCSYDHASEDLSALRMLLKNARSDFDEIKKNLIQPVDNSSFCALI